MMLDVKQFEPEDALMIHEDSTDDVSKGASKYDIMVVSEMYIDSGPCFTGTIDGKPIVSGGINLRKNNTGRIWLLFTNTAVSYKLAVMRSLKCMLNAMIKEYDIKKLYSESRIGFPESQRVLELFGFKKQRRNFNNEYYFYRKVI